MRGDGPVLTQPSLLDKRAGELVDLADVEDDGDVEERHGAVQEDQLVDQSHGDLGGEASQEDDVGCPQQTSRLSSR